MTLEQLWAGWRSAYVSGATGDAIAAASDASVVVNDSTAGCVLCRILAPGDDAEHFVLWRGTFGAAVLNAYPYTSGHLMVAPTRHVGELEDLRHDEAAQMWSGVTDAVRAIKTAYGPDGINIGVNLGEAAGAGVPGHLHVHLLPRWAGDTNFMTSVASVRVIPEALPDTWARLRASWPSAAS